MEEELNDNDFEDRIFSLLHHANETQENSNVNQKDVLQIIQNTPCSTISRYWRPGVVHSPFQKVNTPKDCPANVNTVTENTDSRGKEDNRDVVPSADLLSISPMPASQNLKRTIKILDNDVGIPITELVSSDDDEVIEVELPPKPTITIESSDEDEVCTITEQKATTIEVTPEKKSPEREREVLASPVPSVVSSVSDEFIRGDCIALNISSRHPNNPSFDFSLHGPDLLVQTSSKKKKKKKNKDSSTPTPVTSTPTACEPVLTDKEECFATPRSKAKNKRQRTKSYVVSEKSIPNPDVYDSDSNQSSSEVNKNPPKSVEKAQNPDIYESDSNQSLLNVTDPKQDVVTVEAAVKKGAENQDNSRNNDCLVVEAHDIVDLTDTPEQETSVLTIDENIVMGNVSGLSEQENFDNSTLPLCDDPKLGSTNVPAILYDDLDFNNLNGKERGSKKRRYSLTTLRAEMEKFYNESWGGENFNHREIQKYMSRDKNLWVIDPKDRISALSKRKVTCNYCNRQGHRDDTCRLKPQVCYMCGSIGHNEPRCPRKICVNCGSPNHMYSSLCRNCFNWRGVTCAECGQGGHPATHCPDLWRRYHNTISENSELEENHQMKKHYQMFCSGCTRRGHLVHTCRLAVPFSNLPINSPYVSFYNPIYPPTTKYNQTYPSTFMQLRNNQQDDTITSGTIPHRVKRQSKSPVVHETHLNKKRNLSITDADMRADSKSPVSAGQKRKISLTKDIVEDISGRKEPNKADAKIVVEVENNSNSVSVSSGNHDKRGQMIQDNQVSDTSDVVTSARIFVTKYVKDELNKTEGKEWLNETAEKNNITVQKHAIDAFLSIQGTVGDQEAFQTELRDWIDNKTNVEIKKSDPSNAPSDSDQSLSNNIPKNKNNVLRIINKALVSLNDDLGDPSELFRELNYLRKRRVQLTKQKIISPKQLANCRVNMNNVLRKLNMVLLGQAGLADGTKHLDELSSLYEKITNFKRKIIPPQLRAEIGQHFHSIFTSNPREDYEDLLDEYYLSQKTPVISKNKKNDRYKLNPKQKHNGNMNAPIMPMIHRVEDAPVKRPLVDKTMHKLVFYHRRLLHARPIDAVLKKTRMILVKELRANIATLEGNPYTSAKSLKKMRRIQEQVQLFLANV